MEKEELKVDLDRIKQEIERTKKTKEEFEKLPEDDKKFVMINTAMVYHNGINAIERLLIEMQKIVQALVPETPDVLKILLARLEDIDPRKIDELSAGFIANTFIIDGKELKVTLPEVGEYDDLEYKRFVIRQIKVCDEQAAVAVEYLTELKKYYMEEIPKDVRELLRNNLEVDKWVEGYFRRKANDPSTSPEEKAHFQQMMKYRDYAYTLAPIIDSIKRQIEKNGNPDSIIKGFFLENDRVLKAAINVSSKKNFKFPFQMCSDLDSKLFGDKYDKKYRNLFLYLLARHIKYRGDMITEYERVFFTALMANMVILNRPGGIEKYPDLADKLRKSIGECMDLVIRN